MAILQHRRAITQSFLSSDRTPLDRKLSIDGPVPMNHLLRNLGANILILFLICGCVTPSRKVLPLSTKATPMGTRQLHRHPTIHANSSTRHELSDVEKD